MAATKKVGALAGNATPTSKGRKKAKPQPVTILTRETRGLILTISDEEWRQASEDLGAAHGEMGEHLETAKQIKDDIKAHETEITARIGKLARLVRNRSETRPVECEVHAHHDKGEALTIRTDTGEIIGRRALTAPEKQLPLVQTGPRPSQAQEVRQVVAGRSVDAYERGQADRAGVGEGEPQPPGPYAGETAAASLDALRWQAGYDAEGDPLDGWEAPLELMEQAWTHGRLGRSLAVAKREAPAELEEYASVATQAAIEVSWNEGADAKGTQAKNPYKVEGE